MNRRQQYTLHTRQNHWTVDPERGLVMDSEGVVRAYSELHGRTVDEQLTITWAPNRFGDRKTHAGKVLRITEEDTDRQRTFDQQLRRQAARHQALLAYNRELRQNDQTTPSSETPGEKNVW